MYGNVTGAGSASEPATRSRQRRAPSKASSTKQASKQFELFADALRVHEQFKNREKQEKIDGKQQETGWAYAA
jgi:hypothetical protein